MTVDQIAKLRDYHTKDDGTGRTMADVVSYVFNNELAYVNTRDFIITDDSTELIHAIKANIEDPVNQARYPYKVMTGFYGNIQYVEAMYNMNNFNKVIEELFLNEGLINQTQYDMIIDWSKGIRNQACVPKQPGPYYKDTILPIPKPPVPEIRDDGIWHGSPIGMPTLVKKIEDIITPLIENSGLGVIKKTKNRYVIETDDASTFPAEFKAIIEGMGEDLFVASLADAHTHAIYDPKVDITVETFEKYAERLMPVSTNFEKGLVLFIEAYNVRAEYHFDIFLHEKKEMTDAEWYIVASKELNSMFDNFNPATGKISRSGKSLNCTISQPVPYEDIAFLIDDASSIDGVEMIKYTVGSTTLEYLIGDDISLNNFIEGVINTMPNSNISEVTNGSVAAVSATGASVNYTFKVKYYNEAECPVEIDGVKYVSVEAAAAAAPAGATINMITDENAIGSTTIVNDITIEGNNNTINSSVDVKKSVIISSDKATINNLNIVNAYESNEGGRAINTDGNTTELNISGCNLEVAGTKPNSQVITIGGNQNGNTINMNLDNVKANAGKMGYAIIAFNKNETVIENSEVGGYCAIYMKPANNSDGTNGSIVTVKNSTLNGINNFSGTSDDFAAIVFEDSNCVVNLENTTVNAIENGTAKERIVLFSTSTYPECSNNILNIGEGCIINGDITCTEEYINGNKIIVTGGSFDHDPTAYLADGYEVNLVDGRYVVSAKPIEETVENTVDTFLEGLSYEGVVIEADPEIDNTYEITTSTGSITECGLIDEVAAIPGVVSITVSDGATELTHDVATGDIEAFKASIDELIPKSNTASEVTVSMIINC